MTKHGSYPRHRDTEVEASPSFPQLEGETLAFWAANKTFQKSIDIRPAGESGENEFVFYDGPPFANGLPHYGHLLTGYVKDVVGRYQTMLGHRVERRFGWDTHGLPAELEAQRILGIDDVTEITREGGIGIEAFNDACRTSVLRYTKEWEDYVTRQARWVDFSKDYKTLDPDYMESVIWAFKTLYDKGLAYEGYRVLPYCWHDRTPLSNHELKMDDEVYQDRQDNTVTVGMRLTEPLLPGAAKPELVLIWTTTPWTLPSNLAVAAGPKIDYVVVRVASELASPLAGETVVLGKERLAAYAKELGEEPEVLATLKGSDLVGRRYHPIFDYYDDAEHRAEGAAPGPKGWTIISGDYVTTEDGTGLVHIAPAFGEDDMFVCMEAGIKPVLPVDEGALFTSEVSDYEGLQVFDANKPIIADLRDGTGSMARRDPAICAVLVQQKSYVHSYPHCWRCRKPLIYKAVSSWFVKVTAIRDRMVELNQQITWTPEHTKDGIFGNWLAGARDWSISRNRFWGAPIPVWRSDDPNYPREDVYGSYAELERDFGVKVDNLHRPYIDELVRPNPDDPTGKSMMRRIPDVLDCWFESGSMPYAQVHYPFENRDWFESHYPGDFIVEYIGQTRGWFYTLHVLATALFDRPAFTSVISHGIVLGDDGRKMSKSLRNYPDVNEVFDEYGSDAMRWFLMSSPVVRGGNLMVTETGIRDTVRQVLLPIWNAYYFFALYAGAANKGEGLEAELLDLADPSVVDALGKMDRYLLAHTKSLADEVRAALDAYDIGRACELIRDYIDILTNWYVRTQRQRFWDEDRTAFDTLYTALVRFMELSAPLLPLLSEEVWKGLTGGESVHLVDFPSLPDAVADDALVAAMDEVREVVSTAHSLRKVNQLRVRQPLAQMTVVSEQAGALAPFADLIASEVNVKSVDFLAPAESGLKVSTELGLNPRAFGPQIRKLTSQLFKAQKAGEWSVSEDGTCVFASVMVEGAPVVLTPEQYTVTTTVEAAEGQVAEVLASGTVVVLDTELTPELEAEGYARDVVRAVQDERKNAGLHVADRITLTLGVPAEHVGAVEAHREMIAHETLALELGIAEAEALSVSVAKM
ncbi:MAG: isoleucine--tRNA ligase [Schaalia hyovaginalis]|uniref:isoleucine--tRNA ligase n=1 Tax=Schaalia hyovaginalis TaxID=29316 RepID=UPI0026EE6BBA|nr:isoleucine--tRNA ligase [Schaalia hyovaginalis]MCI6410663.1 isoleucine--tRNA ligase [Schaalia hyovaginalis]MDY3665621.1 isoleucine--tRNA ligase [Schaalia hyovaginalis]MDY4262601.1 isoleucine--tRNA ligase [Schaalia hyovaginalis]